MTELILMYPLSFYSSLPYSSVIIEILSYTKFTYISVLIGCHCNELCLWEEVSL